MVYRLRLLEQKPESVSFTRRRAACVENWMCTHGSHVNPLFTAAINEQIEVLGTASLSHDSCSKTIQRRGDVDVQRKETMMQFERQIAGAKSANPALPAFAICSPRGFQSEAQIEPGIDTRKRTLQESKLEERRRRIRFENRFGSTMMVLAATTTPVWWSSRALCVLVTFWNGFQWHFTSTALSLNSGWNSEWPIQHAHHAQPQWAGFKVQQKAPAERKLENIFSAVVVTSYVIPRKANCPFSTSSFYDFLFTCQSVFPHVTIRP